MIKMCSSCKQDIASKEFNGRSVCPKCYEKLMAANKAAIAPTVEDKEDEEGEEQEEDIDYEP